MTAVSAEIANPPKILKVDESDQFLVNVSFKYETPEARKADMESLEPISDRDDVTLISFNTPDTLGLSVSLRTAEFALEIDGACRDDYPRELPSDLRDWLVERKVNA